MNGSLGNLNIQLSLDTARFSQNIESAKRQAKQFSDMTSQSLKVLEKDVSSLASATKKADWFLKGNAIVASAKILSQYADTYTELKNRITLVTSSQMEQAAAMDNIYQISLKTNQALGATTQVYQRFAQNAERLGLSQADVANLTETVSKAVAMSGASATSAEAALMQFGQALGSAELRGDELNSVMEQTPGLAGAIAKGLGVTTGELKKMAKAGELDIPNVINALKKVRSSVDDDFSHRIKTLSGAFTNLDTAFTKYVGNLDQSFGVTQKAAQGVEYLANNLENLIEVAGLVLGSLAIGHIGKYTTAMTTNALQVARNVKEHRSQAKALLEVATNNRIAAQADMALMNEEYKLAQSEQTRHALRERMKVQAREIIALAEQERIAKINLANANNLAAKASGLLKGALGLIGGPAGAATIAASALIYFVYQAKEARAAAIDTASANDQLKESYDGLTEATITSKIFEQIDAIKKQREETEKLAASVVLAKVSQSQGSFFSANETDIAKKQTDYQRALEVSQAKTEVLKNQISALGTAFLRNGKSLDEFKAKLKTMGVEGEIADQVIASMPKNLSELENKGNGATTATLDLKEAMAKLQEKSTSLAQQLEVAKLEQQGHGESAYILAGLYELLGKEASNYNDILLGIAKGEITAANASDKAANMSIETLQKLLDARKTLSGMFENKTKTETIQTNIKKSGGSDKGENARQNFLSFFDELRQKSGSTLNEINLEQDRMFKRLEEHNKKGVVSHSEYEAAKLAITERFAKQRLELAGKYAPEKLLASQLKDEIAAIQELKNAGQLSNTESANAELQAKFQYAQQMSQNAVSPLDQMRAIYDPNQDQLNKQKQELAQLQGFYDQKLMAEEEFQQRKKEIIDRYQNDQFQSEMTKYAEGVNNLGNAFGSMASMVEQSSGKQSAAYKVLFATSKAFAIAESAVKLSQAVAQAMADPTALTPAQKFANMAAVMSAGMNLVTQISSVGFSRGGYTGDGGKYSPAGIVHRGEYVITKEATSRLGVDYLNYLNYGKRGFANGGGVGVPSVPAMNYQGNTSPKVTVKVINNGEPVQAEVRSKSEGNSMEITVELMRTIAKQEANSAIQQNFRAGGVFSR